MPPSQETPVQLLKIEKVTVRTGRLAVIVRLAPGAPRYATPQVAARLRERFPTLPLHACVNEVGDTFGSVMDSTSLPHVLEHLVIDLQVRAHANESAPTFVGTTEWLDEAAGTALVQVSFADDLIALRALRDAADILNQAVVS